MRCRWCVWSPRPVTARRPCWPSWPSARALGWVGCRWTSAIDPAVLLTYIAVAMDRVEPIDPRIVRGLAGPGASILGAVPRLAEAMAAMTQPVALVLDHLGLLENQACLDLVAELAAQLPAGSQLLLASRARPPLPVAVLRPQGRVMELGSRNSPWTTRWLAARAVATGACRRRCRTICQRARAAVRARVAARSVRWPGMLGHPHHQSWFSLTCLRRSWGLRWWTTAP